MSVWGKCRKNGGLLFLLFPAILFSFGGKEDIGVFSKERVVSSTHFRLHHEDSFAPVGVLNTLEGLHAKLFLDLGDFSPWANQEPIHVFLYKDAASYAAHTGMPSWAVAHINVQMKTVYGHPAPDLQRVLAHELGHLFFTQFFLVKSTAPPLWLNEGVATLMEWQYGLEADQKAMDRRLLSEGRIPFVEFLSSNYAQAGEGDGERVGLWYNQAQSVTRFLMRGFSRAQFLRFCQELRLGRSLDESLHAAYGLAVPNTASLERLWRDSLSSR